MTELVFLKLGGSLITDKTTPYTIRSDKLARLVDEIHAAQTRTPNLRLVLGHGAGSFGHTAANLHGTRNGVHNEKEWRGFAEVRFQAGTLNHFVMQALHKANIPAMSIQPSAGAIAHDAKVLTWDAAPILKALSNGILPVVYGDTIFDELRGGTILSTEDLFEYLAHQLAPARILLAGLEAGVWSDFPARQQMVGKVTPKTYDAIAGKVGGSHGADVTGGMKSKVEQMLRLVGKFPQMTVQIFSGEEAGNLEKVLQGRQLGTLIASD